MSDIYKDRERGIQAESLLKHPLWDEVWTAYRARLFEEIEKHAGSTNAAATGLLLARLSVAASVRTDVERIMKDGVIAASQIEFEERKKKGFIRELLDYRRMA